MNRVPSFSMRLSPEMREELENLAKADRRPLASYVKLVLEKHIEEKRREARDKSGK